MLSCWQGYDLELMRNIKLVDASPEGKVEWEFCIPPFYANLNGEPYQQWVDNETPTADPTARRDAWRSSWCHLWYEAMNAALKIKADEKAEMGTTSALCTVQKKDYWE